MECDEAICVFGRLRIAERVAQPVCWCRQGIAGTAGRFVFWLCGRKWCAGRMTEYDLRKLKRNDLLEMMLDQAKELERVKQELEQRTGQLEQCRKELEAARPPCTNGDRHRRSRLDRRCGPEAQRDF